MLQRHRQELAPLVDAAMSDNGREALDVYLVEHSNLKKARLQRHFEEHVADLSKKSGSRGR